MSSCPILREVKLVLAPGVPRPDLSPEGFDDIGLCPVKRRGQLSVRNERGRYVEEVAVPKFAIGPKHWAKHLPVQTCEHLDRARGQVADRVPSDGPQCLIEISALKR